MKLQLVPARTGFTWVKLGIRTFCKQPLALSGLFFIYMAVVSVASLIPILGTALALGLFPAASLGLMAATREAESGRFPMPSVLLSAFRAGRRRLQDMLVLGALYAVGVLLIVGLSALIDGGQFARLYLFGSKLTQELPLNGEFLGAIWLWLLLVLPLSLLVWHATALVHWYGEPPIKALFYSLVASCKNIRALALYALIWMGLFMSVGAIIGLASDLSGNARIDALILMPASLIMAAMFFSSVYFTFRDSFVASEESDSP
jgi:hypothetical protein